MTMPKPTHNTKPELVKVCATESYLGWVMTVKASQLQIPFYVRRAQSPERIGKLQELLRNGQTFPPLLTVPLDKDPFTGPYQIIDGRSRLDATLLENGDDADIQILVCCTLTTVPARMAAAVKCNENQSQPLTKLEIEHVFMKLLDTGFTRAAIYKEFAYYPSKVVLRWIDDAVSKITERQLGYARREVAEGDISVTEAAKKYGVRADTLGKTIARENGTGEKDDSVLKVTAGVSSTINSVRKTIGNHLGSLRTRKERGDITREEFAYFTQTLYDLVDKWVWDCEGNAIRDGVVLKIKRRRDRKQGK